MLVTVLNWWLLMCWGLVLVCCVDVLCDVLVWWWCVDDLCCCCVAVLSWCVMCWCVDVLILICWCADVLVCLCVDGWPVDVLITLRWYIALAMCSWLCWCVDDVLMIVNPREVRGKNMIYIYFVFSETPKKANIHFSLSRHPQLNTSTQQHINTSTQQHIPSRHWLWNHALESKLQYVQVFDLAEH